MDRPVRIAAAGDIHSSEAHAERLKQAFAGIEDSADLILLAGDVTTHGAPEEARVLATVCRGLDVPVYAVLGNHDYHANRVDEVTEELEGAGIHVLQRDFAIREVNGVEVGIVGTKGFVGGFPGSTLPDFGEPLLRQVYEETTEEANAIAHGLQEISHCPLRVVLLHYSPSEQTLAGEPLGILAFLGSSRLALPIAEYPPDLVLHGHAHAGSFEGRIGEVPVYNVAVHVTGRDFYVFDLCVTVRGPAEVEVEATPGELA
jgi:Icc-related predicted phosphoesterase